MRKVVMMGGDDEWRDEVEKMMIGVRGADGRQLEVDNRKLCV